MVEAAVHGATAELVKTGSAAAKAERAHETIVRSSRKPNQAVIRQACAGATFAWRNHSLGFFTGDVGRTTPTMRGRSLGGC